VSLCFAWEGRRGKGLGVEKGSGLNHWVWKGLVPDWVAKPTSGCTHQFFNSLVEGFQGFRGFSKASLGVFCFFFSGFWELQVGIADVGAFRFCFEIVSS
jgi:hypothetical protein